MFELGGCSPVWVGRVVRDVHRGFVVAPCRLENGLRSPTEKGIKIFRYDLHPTEMIRLIISGKDQHKISRRCPTPNASSFSHRGTLSSNNQQAYWIVRLHSTYFYCFVSNPLSRPVPPLDWSQSKKEGKATKPRLRLQTHGLVKTSALPP